MGVIMKSEILKIVYDYSINKRIVDEEFIEKLINIIITKKELTPFLEKIVFIPESIECNDEAFSPAGYYPLLKEIRICINLFEKIFINRNKIIQTLNANELFFYKNTAITQIILHELEHVYQNKKIFIGEEDLETKLLKVGNYHFAYITSLRQEMLSSKDEVLKEQLLSKINERRRLYSQYYIYNHCERMAQINSYKVIMNAISPIEGLIPSVVKNTSTCVRQQLSDGFEINFKRVCAPTIVYMQALGYQWELENFYFYNRNKRKLLKNISELHSLDDRLLFGLPISKEEFYKIKV
jgi:hypothetical protein